MHISTKLSIAIHCLILINEYGDKIKLTSEMMAISTGCNPVTIRSITSALKKANILSVKFGTGGTTLNCPPENIDLYTVYMAIEPNAFQKMIGIHSMPSPLCPVGKNINELLKKPYSKICDDLTSSLKSITLKELTIEYHKILKTDNNPNFKSLNTNLL